MTIMGSKPAYIFGTTACRGKCNIASVCRSKQGKAAKPPKQSRTEREAGEKREQMAAAAEARMARLKLASQQQQLWS